MTFEHIKVEFEVYVSSYEINTQLKKLLSSKDLLAFDTETRSLYGPEERMEAAVYAAYNTPDAEYFRQAKLVAESSGLSFPEITHTTHFIFGTSREHSIVFVCDTLQKEMLVWNALKTYTGTLIVHNSLFDLKIMYHRTRQLPCRYIDTAVYAKCLINHVNTWKAKVGLKDLMSPYYDPKWTAIEGYEPEDLKDPKFLRYAAIDGAATFYCWELIQDMIADEV